VADASDAWHAPEWQGTAQERAVAMFAEAVKVDQQPENLFAADHMLALYRMYEQRPITALSAYAGNFYGGTSLSASIPTVAVSEWNVLRAVVNTGHAMIARSKVRGRFITSKGTGKQKRRAQDATHWLDGWSEESDLHYLAGQALRDAMVAPFGVLQLFVEDNKVRLQRVLPMEISFDHVSAMYGKPKTIYRKRAVSKASLIARFGKGKPAVRDAILAAKVLDFNGMDTVADMVLVREAYSLASSAKSKDGWHTVAIEGQDGALLSEPYEKPWWPFVFFIWEPTVTGLSGISLAAQLEPMQAQLNFMMLVERKAQRLMLAPRIYLQKGSKIVQSQITNQIGSVIEGTGQAPTVLNWNALPSEFYQAKDKLIEKMYALSGISQNASEGTKPPGTESGAAQREAMEQQNLRIQIYAQQAWEKPIVEIFNRAVEMAADIVADGNTYEVEASGPKGVNVVDFKGTVTDLKTKKVTIFPTGFLPLTPAARLDFILQMIQAQLWDVDRAREALADLDVDSEQSLENSIQQMFVKKFERMLYDGKPAHPTELDVGYYQIAIKNAAVYQALVEIEPESTSPKNVALLQRYVQELKQMQPPPAPAQPAQPVARAA
jgi:hypothetical protein